MIPASYDIIIIAKIRNEPCGSNPAGLFLCHKGGEPMPKKPKRPCSFPGCPKLTDGWFCEEHEKLENKRYEKYDRDSAVRRRYGRAWKRIRFIEYPVE